MQSRSNHSTMSISGGTLLIFTHSNGRYHVGYLYWCSYYDSFHVNRFGKELKSNWFSSMPWQNYTKENPLVCTASFLAVRACRYCCQLVGFNVGSYGLFHSLEPLNFRFPPGYWFVAGTILREKARFLIYIPQWSPYKIYVVIQFCLIKRTGRDRRAETSVQNLSQFVLHESLYCCGSLCCFLKENYI